MQEIQLPFYVFSSPGATQRAAQSLCNFGFDAQKLSMLGRVPRPAAPTLAFHAWDNHSALSDNLSIFWSSAPESLFAPVAIELPNVGLMVMAGPVVPALIRAVGSADDGESAIEVALTQLGIPAAHAGKYQSALANGEYVLIVHGNATEVLQARSVLAICQAWKAA